MTSTIASTFDLSRPSEKLGTHSTSVCIGEEYLNLLSHSTPVLVQLVVILAVGAQPEGRRDLRISSFQLLFVMVQVEINRSCGSISIRTRSASFIVSFPNRSLPPRYAM